MDLKVYVKNNKSQISKYKKYLKEVDWSNIEVRDSEGRLNEIKTYEKREKEYKLQKSMAESVLKRVEVLTKKYFQDRKESQYRTLLKNGLEVIHMHVDRSDLYDSNIDLISDSSDYIRQKEMEMSDIIFSSNANIRDKLSSLNLSIEDEAGLIEFHADSKAPLVMHEKLCVIYPQIKDKMKAMKIDFDSEPEPKLFIHDPKPPVWDVNKHYFDQEPKTIQYYVDEIKKIRNGIILDGVYISPWMYYHINFFVTKFPTTFINPKTGKQEVKDLVATPPLRDNEWWVINDNYELAKERGEMMFLAATRRAAKTTMETSHLGMCVVQSKLELIVAGGSSKDLDVLQKNFEILQLNTHPALRVPFLLEDWGKRVELGIKTKQNKTILNSFLKIINMDGGANSKSEVFAGITPDAVIIDEIMKLKFKSQLEGLKPALDAPGGKRCVAILAGTSGNSELAKDAFDVLRFPTDNGILSMPWDKFNKMVPEEYRTWKEREFGTFIPAQMSAKDGMVKIDSNLSDFIGVDSDILRGVDIKVTDWKNSIEIIRGDREIKKRDLELYTKEVLYYPICPSDMLLSGKINPFPVTEAIMHKEYILEKGGCVGRKVFLTQDPTGKIKITDSNNQLPDYPYGGGFIDSPAVLYEDIPETQPADYLYVAGFDDYKQDESGTDSVGSFHIYKVDVGFDRNCGKIVASYAARPDPHGKLHHQIYMLQQAFNAKCFMENADMDYKAYLERMHVADKWLMTSLDFDGDITREGASARKYGWTPTVKNKKFLFSLLINYCKRIFTEYDEDGNPFQVLGVQKIDDIGLLEEIIAYTEGANVDRCTSFMSCLGYEFYLNANYLLPNLNIQIEQRREQTKKTIRTSGNPFFGKGRPKKYF